jgi:two-component system, NtrC family, sensor histidine kinase HydH
MEVMTTATELMASIPDVAKSVIHDFRNPLATIRASSEILIRSGLSEPQIQRIARNVQGASIRMQELVEEFLDQYRGAQSEPERTDLRELATNAVERIAYRAESQSVAIVQNIPDGLEISVEPNRIHRVLVNLLVNAVEVMPDGGTIYISAAVEPDTVLIQIRDTGPGIAPEIRSRLFQPFVTAGKARGIGLGLSFSRQAVIDHGGEMWAESSPRGACFALRLPRAIAQERHVSC